MRIELNNAVSTCDLYKRKCIELQKQNDLLALKMSKVVKEANAEPDLGKARKIKVLGNTVNALELRNDTVEELIQTLEDNQKVLLTTK